MFRDWAGLRAGPPACRRKLAVLSPKYCGLGWRLPGVLVWAPLQTGLEAMLCSWGCQPGSLPQLGSRMSVTAAQGLWLGLRVRQGWRLCLAVERSCSQTFTLLVGLEEGLRHWDSPPAVHPNWAELLLGSLARQATGLGLQMGRAAG